MGSLGFTESSHARRLRYCECKSLTGRYVCLQANCPNKVAWGVSQAADDFVTSFGPSDCPAASQLSWASFGHWKPALTHAWGQDGICCARTGEGTAAALSTSQQWVSHPGNGWQETAFLLGKKMTSVPSGCPLPCHQLWVPNVFKGSCCDTCPHPLPAPCSGGCLCSLLPPCSAPLCKPWMLTPYPRVVLLALTGVLYKRGFCGGMLEGGS